MSSWQIIAGIILAACLLTLVVGGVALATDDDIAEREAADQMREHERAAKGMEEAAMEKVNREHAEV